jgi:hypothetical protein
MTKETSSTMNFPIDRQGHLVLLLCLGVNAKRMRLDTAVSTTSFALTISLDRHDLWVW